MATRVFKVTNIDATELRASGDHLTKCKIMYSASWQCIEAHGMFWNVLESLVDTCAMV